MRYRLILTAEIRDGIIAQAQSELPNECCGILLGAFECGGRNARALSRFALVNELASPRAYRSEPRSMFEAERTRRARGWEFVAVYHSHPISEPVPSRIDLENSYGPDMMNLIVSLKGPSPALRAWWLAAYDYTEAEFVIE